MDRHGEEEAAADAGMTVAVRMATVAINATSLTFMGSSADEAILMFVWNKLQIKSALKLPQRVRELGHVMLMTLLVYSLKAFFQGYNAPAVVNEDQIIVANDLIASPGDAKQLPGMMAKVRCNTDSLPDVLLADAGYFSEVNVGFLKKLKVKALIPPDRQDQRAGKPNPRRKNATAKRMRKLLEAEWGHRLYRKRKALVEPVFGQIKSCMCFT